MADPQQLLDYDPADVDDKFRALTELGSRPVGSAAESRAREFVEESMRAEGLDVRRERFPYLGWSLEQRPALRVGAGRWSADALAFTYSPPTPAGGLSGTIEWVGQHWVAGLYRWEKFRIADETGATVGYVSARPDGPPMPAALAESSSPVPHFIIGADDLARLQTELGGPTPVIVSGKLDARLDRTATGVNLEARIAGTAPAPLHIGLCAHLDTADLSPRADGATRALMAVLALVRHYARRPAPHSIKVLIFTGTEADIAGSKAYVADHPDIWDLSLAINLDEIPDGEPQLVASVPEAFEARLRHLIDSIDPGTCASTAVPCHRAATRCRSRRWAFRS